jgi:hypothetical protein
LRFKHNPGAHSAKSTADGNWREMLPPAVVDVVVIIIIIILVPI